MSDPAPVRPRARGHRGYSSTAPRTPETVGAARDLTRLALMAWAVPDHAKETAAQLMSELATNAIMHARTGRVRIVVDRLDDDSDTSAGSAGVVRRVLHEHITLAHTGRVRLAVIDRAPGLPPHRREPEPTDTSGRGLLLLDAFADRWGYDLLGGARLWGKRVWAELAVPE